MPSPRTTQPWVLPLVFTLVTLSLPVQILVASRVSEPYPGLFLPPFGTVPRVRDNGFGYSEAQFSAGGRRLKSEDLFLTTYRPRLQELIESTFPKDPAEGFEVPAAAAQRIRANIVKTSGPPAPTHLSVVWQRRRFNAVTGRTTEVRTEASYEVDLLTGRLR